MTILVFYATCFKEKVRGISSTALTMAVVRKNNAHLGLDAAAGAAYSASSRKGENVSTQPTKLVVVQYNTLHYKQHNFKRCNEPEFICVPLSCSYNAYATAGTGSVPCGDQDRTSMMR